MPFEGLEYFFSLNAGRRDWEKRNIIHMKVKKKNFRIKDNKKKRKDKYHRVNKP